MPNSELLSYLKTQLKRGGSDKGPVAISGVDGLLGTPAEFAASRLEAAP